MIHIFKISLLIILAAFTSACQNSMGSGPLKLSHSSAKGFERYLKEHNGLYFSVTEDGRNHYYTYCKANNCRKDPLHWITDCEESYPGQKCRLFAKKEKVVWKNPGNFMPFHSDVIAQKLGQSYHNGPADKKEVPIIWEVILEEGRLIFEPPVEAGQAGQMYLAANTNYLVCNGIYDLNHFHEGIWSLECSNGEKSNGIFYLNTTEKTLYGRGKDTQQRKIKFDIPQ